MQLATVGRSVSEGLAAAGLAIAGFHDRLIIARRTHLSLAEEALSNPYLSNRSVMSFLCQEDALELRLASRACRDAVAEHAWDDLDPSKPED